MDENTSMDYSEYLKERLNELGITQAELAEAIGISKSTLRGYKQYYGYSEKVKKRIEAALEEKSRFRDFTHIPSDEFSEKIRKYLEHFKNEITQTELARRAGISGQSQISKIKKSKKFTTEEQYQLLNVFWELCHKTTDNIDNNIHIRDREISAEIYRMLHGEIKALSKEECHEMRILDTISQDVMMNGIIEALTEYPVKMQDLILENHLAFFDSAQILFNDDQRFLQAEAYITIFREDFNSEQRAWFMHRLEKLTFEKKVFLYYEHTDNWKLFEMVTHYRGMIKTAKERRIADPEIKPPSFWGEPPSNSLFKDRSFEFIDDDNKKVNIELQIRKFEKVFNQLLESELNMPSLDAKSIILNEIDFRLDMSPMEWYVWMMIAGYAYAYQETGAIDKLILKISGKI